RPLLVPDVARRYEGRLALRFAFDYAGRNEYQICRRSLDAGQVHEIVMLPKTSDLAEVFLARANHDDYAVLDLFEQLLSADAIFGSWNTCELVIGGDHRGTGECSSGQQDGQ